MELEGIKGIVEGITLNDKLLCQMLKKSDDDEPFKMIKISNKGINYAIKIRLPLMTKLVKNQTYQKPNQVV